MKVYVLLQWWYEGDSNLVDSFIGVYSSYQKALEDKVKFYPNQELVSSEEAKRRTYESGGGYGSPSYFEIIECNV